MVMAVGTVGCGVVDLCGSESTILIAFVVLFVVAYINININIKGEGDFNNKIIMVTQLNPSPH